LKGPFAAAFALSLAACAGVEPQAVVVQNHVSVVILPSPDELPFDPADARLEEASAQLEALAGHPIAFEFDVALLPDWRVGFQDMLIQSIESVARDLDHLKREKPLVFARGVPRLDRVVSRYDATAVDRPDVKLDPEGSAVTIVGPARRWGVARGEVAEALEDEYSRWEAARFATARAQDVPAAERRGYFEFLTTRNDARARDPREPREPDADAVVGAVALSSLIGASDPRLAADVRTWLLGAARDFASAYEHDQDRVVALPSWSRWRRAEASWVAWANAAVPTMTDEEKLALVESVFVRTRGSDGAYHAASFAFPGFDRFAFGLSIADAWARAGHPRGGSQLPAQRELFGAVVCPRSEGDDGGASFVGRCDYVWYRDALDDEATTRRLTDALLARKDLDLVEAVFAAVDFMPAGGDKLGLLFGLAQALDTDDGEWRRAFRVVADDRAEGGDTARWVDEARRQWVGHPSRHGTLLYALAKVGRSGEDKVGWERFAATFGAPIDARDFAAYLSESAHAMSLAAALWPALSPVWSRAAVLVPRLDAYLDDRATRRYDSQDPERALGAIARRLCEEGSVADMGQIRAYLGRRIASHPGEDYASTFTESKECARRAARPRAGGSPTAPADHGPLAPAPAGHGPLAPATPRTNLPLEPGR
jgi:hypothetical protein